MATYKTFEEMQEALDNALAKYEALCFQDADPPQVFEFTNKYECDCSHQTPVKKEYSNGVIVAALQCIVCGKHTTHKVKKAAFADFEKYPFVDSECHNKTVELWRVIRNKMNYARQARWARRENEANFEYYEYLQSDEWKSKRLRVGS